MPPAPQDAPYGIRPGAPGDRQPPAEFDSLFRADGPPQQGAEAPQLPRFRPLRTAEPAAAAAPYQPPQAPARSSGRSRSRRQPPTRAPGSSPGTSRSRPGARSPVGLIAAVVVGCAAIGLGAGALLSGGERHKKDDKQPAGVSSPATGDGGGAKGDGADPAKAQAEALDKVLADSGSSRDAVIGAVADIRKCDKLDQASASLRGAAKQRGDLVTRLGALSLDKLPDHDKLSGGAHQGLAVLGRRRQPLRGVVRRGRRRQGQELQGRPRQAHQGRGPGRQGERRGDQVQAGGLRAVERHRHEVRPDQARRHPALGGRPPPGRADHRPGARTTRPARLSRWRRSPPGSNSRR